MTENDTIRVMMPASPLHTGNYSFHRLWLTSSSVSGDGLFWGNWHSHTACILTIHSCGAKLVADKFPFELKSLLTALLVVQLLLSLPLAFRLYMCPHKEYPKVSHLASSMARLMALHPADLVTSNHWLSYTACKLWGCIQKLLDQVDNEIYAYHCD
jgi:hypothetical protein